MADMVDVHPDLLDENGYPAALGPVLDRVDAILQSLGMPEEAVLEAGELLYRLALDGFTAGVNAAPAYLVSGNTAADELGVSPARIRQLAADLEIGFNLPVGNGSVRLFTPDDMERLRHRGDRRGLWRLAAAAGASGE